MIGNTGAINGSNNVDGQTTNTNESAKRTELDKDAFFKLLITQLKYQDPLKPMENKEFISQMAQFSSLEQMQNMNDSMSDFLKVQSLSEGSALIGKTVETYQDDEGIAIKGEVTKVSYEDENLYLYLDGSEDKKISLAEIKTVY